MPVPSRAAQIKRVAEFLEDSVDKERTLDQVATIIVDSIYDMWTVDILAAPTVPKVGMAFKTPAIASKIYFVAWIGEEYEGREVAWIVDAAADYGVIAPVDSSFWRIITLSSSKGGENIANKDGWKAGDKLSLMQRTAKFEILAVGDKAVLLRNTATGSLQADSNANLKKYYNKERV